MKRFKPLAFSLALFGIWLLASSDISLERSYRYTPYFMQRADLEASVFYMDKGREMENPGKIWVSGDQIFINEKYRGVHIIDNSDPANPRQTGFIMAPGSLDMAVKGNIIYLDNAVDLVAFDLAAKKETERIKNFFPAPASPAGERYYRHGSDMILVGWKKNK